MCPLGPRWCNAECLFNHQRFKRFWDTSLNLNALWKQGKSFLGTQFPILAGAMTWISGSRFVASVCNSGAFGSLAAGNMPPELLDQEIKTLKSQTDKPFGVNLITIGPNYRDLLKVAVSNKVPFIIIAGS